MIIKPIINLNGTAPQDLLDQHMNAIAAAFGHFAAAGRCPERARLPDHQAGRVHDRAQRTP
jgi:hypothetical protein